MELMLRGFEHNYVLSKLQHGITDNIIMSGSSKKRDLLKDIEEKVHTIASEIFADRKGIRSYVSALREIRHELKKIEISTEIENDKIEEWKIHSDTDETTIINSPSETNTLDIIGKDT